MAYLYAFKVSTFFGLFYECCSNVFEREMHGSSRYRNVCRSFKHSFIELPSWPPHFFVLNEHILTAVFHCDEVSFHLNGWFGVGFFCWFSFFSIFSHFFCKEKDLTPAKFSSFGAILSSQSCSLIFQYMIFKIFFYYWF